MTKEDKKEYDKQYYAANRDKRLEYSKEYYTTNREKVLEQKKQYQNTPTGRALRLLMHYNREDKKYNRGKGDLTAKWIIENIFSQPCAYCGKTGWEVIGCNRIDNSKPHTKNNVEPCCKECNDRLAADDKKKQVFQYTLDNELIRVWESIGEAGRNGFHQGNISACCNGIRNTHKGYRWSYQPL